MMDSIRRPKVIEGGIKPDLTWLVGRTLTKVQKDDYTWSFILDDGSGMFTEDTWRLIVAEGIAVTSEDDGHKFGLPAPVNAAERVTDTIGEKPIARFELRNRTNDLVLHFAGDVSIEFLNLSCGYDGWRTAHGQHEIICQGGGRLTELDGG